MKRKRESLDSRLVKLTPEQQMELLIYGEDGPGDAAEQLAMQARAVRGLAKALKVTDGTTSEGYDAILNDLRKRVADLCTRALLDDDTAFFKSVARGLQKARTQVAAWTANSFIRLILLHEAKAGPVNISRFAVRLKAFRGIRKDVRSLRRIAHKLGIPTARRGRPNK